MPASVLLESNNYSTKWHFSSEISYYIPNLVVTFFLVSFPVNWVEFPDMKKRLHVPLLLLPNNNKVWNARILAMCVQRKKNEFQFPP